MKVDGSERSRGLRRAQRSERPDAQASSGRLDAVESGGDLRLRGPLPDPTAPPGAASVLAQQSTDAAAAKLNQLLEAIDRAAAADRRSLLSTLQGRLTPAMAALPIETLREARRAELLARFNQTLRTVGASEAWAPVRSDLIAARRALVKEQIASAVAMAGVPQRKQHFDPKTGDREGNCGFYALGMVLDAHHLRDARFPTAWMQGKDGSDPIHASLAPTTDVRLLDFAKTEDMTNTGELFDAETIAKIANRIGAEARVHRGAKLSTLYEVLERQNPAIVAIDVEKTGNPCEADGLLSHYVVIQGYFDLGGERYLVARHGWAAEEDHVWPASDFERSWQNLSHTDYYGPTLVDTSKTLASNIVEVLPRSDARRDE